ncbi:hypothetical protein [Candidatus Protofrankia datiscae]|uniref:hypothetical protein n=1 Tax=Candidatus Protofrankia datiscae TaxID=2716812 RepID=UPI00031C05D6|nr:hypothetical protein [Candidatus Protofrankia datiscae]
MVDAARSWWGRLPSAVQATLPVWVASRIAVIVLSLAASRALSGRPLAELPGLRTLWDRWDVGLFTKVARFGYASPEYTDRTEVDFPGFPLAMRLAHLFVPDWTFAGMAVSFVAGAAAMAAIWQMQMDDQTWVDDATADRTAPTTRHRTAVRDQTDIRDRTAVAGRGSLPDTRDTTPALAGAPGGWAASDGWGAPDRRGADFAVIAVVLFPYAVFLCAAYSEAIFLGFATTSWLAARRQRWWLAGLLGAGAASTRVTGIPFCLALAVQYVVSRRRAGLPVFAPAGLALALPPLPVLAFVSYLRVRTGHWDAYTQAMRDGWQRWVDWPWEGWRTSWRSAFDASQSSAFTWFWRGEVAAVVVGVVVTVALLRSARFGEATFVGGATLLMSCSNYYASGIRTMLVAFPTYLLLGRVVTRRPWVRSVYIWLSAPVMVAFVIAFTQGQWVD